MSETLNNIEENVKKDEKIIDIWGRRNPRFEKKYEQSVMRAISDYGIGASGNTGVKGKILGAGYEPYIMAFFIGLYANKRIPLSEDLDDLKGLGQPLMYWGNLDSKKYRKAYSGLRSYIFIALVAKTDIDWIALDKGDIKVNTVVTNPDVPCSSPSYSPFAPFGVRRITYFSSRSFTVSAPFTFVIR